MKRELQACHESSETSLEHLSHAIRMVVQSDRLALCLQELPGWHGTLLLRVPQPIRQGAHCMPDAL